MIEGGLFLSAGLAPGVEEMVQSALGQYPDLLPADKLGELTGFFAILQRLAIAFGALCLAGGWGVEKHKSWGRWPALAATSFNLALFPIFTPLGVAGLLAFLRKPSAVQAEEKEAPPVATERPEPASHLLVLVASMAIVVYLSHELRHFALSRGLPAQAAGRLGLLWILLGQVLFTLIHELGHLAAAWSMGFRFQEVAVGPLVLLQRPGGSWAFRLDAGKLLTAGGYLQAVPASIQDLRTNWMLVILAGPAASLLLALFAFLVMLNLPGSAYASYWTWASYITAICTADFLANLLPLGLTDGALFVHTALMTSRGRGILAGLEAAMLNDRAERQAGLMDPAELFETRRQALEQLERNADPSGLAVAAQRVEFATASLLHGRADEAAEALQEAGKTIEGSAGIPTQVQFRYWSCVYEVATMRRQYSTAANARDRALELGTVLDAEKMDWEERVPIRLACARMWISDGDYFTAAAKVQELRAACPARRSVTSQAVELLTVEAECELRLSRRDAARSLIQAAIEIGEELPDAQRAAAMEKLAHTGVRMSAWGEYAIAQPLFSAAVAGLEKSAAPSVAAGYRTAWAETLYENDRLDDAAKVLQPIHEAHVGFAADIQTLRAQLLLAEDRPLDALHVLGTLLGETPTDTDEAQQNGLARGRALRSWALFRQGELAAAIQEARQACDVLMPHEHPDAAPALLTLAMAVADENGELSDAYLQESTRLISESTLLTPQTKVSRLTDLARSMVQVSRKDWAKMYLEQASRFREKPASPGTPAEPIPTLASH